MKIFKMNGIMKSIVKNSAIIHINTRAFCMSKTYQRPITGCIHVK